MISDDDALRLRLIQLSHDTLVAKHSSETKIYEILTRSYYWPGILASIKQFVRNCHLYARIKIFKDKYHEALKSLKAPKRRWRDISLDFIVGLPESINIHGNSVINILIVIDRLFKQVHYEAMSEISTKNTARAFYRAIYRILLFRIETLSLLIISGTNFVND